MLFIIALALAAAFAFALHDNIRRHPDAYYISAAILTTATALIDSSALPGWVNTYVFGLFSRGAFATALWCIVMCTGALKNGSRAMKVLMPIRGELSITAAILTLSHNIVYGRTYFLRLFSDAGSMAPAQLAAAVLSVCMLVIMLPLTLLSFPKIRKKLPAKKWKRIQRAAYGFYGLLYIHIMLVMVPVARSGRTGYGLSVLVYTAVFSVYLVCRVRKALIKRKLYDGSRLLMRHAAAALPVLCLLGAFVLAYPIQLSASEGAHAAAETTAAAEADATAAPASGAASPAYAESGDAALKTLSGKGWGYDGYVYATVSLDGGTITGISAYTDESDNWYFYHVNSGVIANIIAAQSAEDADVIDLDAVSGATCSAEGLTAAVRNALASAD